MQYPPTTCYRCGNVADILVDDGTSAICEACEEAFQQAMQREYPHGQCWQCGATYRVYTCVQGVAHLFALHSEGGCSQWADWGGREPVGPMSQALGYCDAGCRPPREVLDAYLAASQAAAHIWYDQHYHQAEVRRLSTDGFPIPADDELVDLPF